MSEYAPRPLSLRNLSIREAFIIVAAVSALLIFLVILKFGCAVCIDICLLRDGTAGRRTLRDFWNCLCPLCRTREVEGDDEGEQGNDGGDVEASLSNVNSLLSRLTTRERNLLIGSVLESKIVTEEDLKQWNETVYTPETDDKLDDSDKEATQDTLSVNSEAAAMCSICLHEYHVGQHVSETKACRHLFHGDCVKQWLGSNSRAVYCPCCRADLITESDIKRILHLPIMPSY